MDARRGHGDGEIESVATMVRFGMRESKSFKREPGSVKLKWSTRLTTDSGRAGAARHTRNNASALARERDGTGMVLTRAARARGASAATVGFRLSDDEESELGGS